ncbi:hypothetical protein SSX86_024757 [Deinandra increscens subsp. villosa]|uniref:Large ribosomal subunit protein uL15/eL18 domain-containing protein n=1 Tax=Deinandra increscens subsp. villosa TaxID=3103831 RepID=A0AAP0GKV2_9ASTR
MKLSSLNILHSQFDRSNCWRTISIDFSLSNGQKPIGLGKIARLINAGKIDSSELITMKTLKDTGAIGKQIRDGVRLMGRGAEHIQANMARWEPAHGRFKLGYPWKQYLKVGALMRSCTYCIETLSGFINSEVQAPELLKKHMKEYA